MNLSELEPTFLTLNPNTSSHCHDDFSKADGIMFECPKCHNHQIICWKPHIDPTINPKPGQWTTTGNTYDDLTLSGYTDNHGRLHSESISLSSGCAAHFYVHSGQIIML